MEWPDGKSRCRWANPSNPRYLQYHDQEWGVPVHNDRKLFEMLILENFQAGLSWECVLNKWEAFRRAFDGFDPEKVCAYDEAKIDALQNDPEIIRNCLKIQAAVNNAKVFRRVQQECGSFSTYLWRWTNDKVIYEKGETRSALSDAISKDLKKRGMKFVGTTIIYAYLQAVGVIFSHDEGCFLEHKGETNVVTVRKATTADAERLLEIYDYYVKNTAITFEYDTPSIEEFRGRMEQTMRRYPYLVIEKDNVLQGYAYAGAFVGRAAYDWSCEMTVYLDHTARGNGLGRKMYKALEAELKKMGILNLYACIGYPEADDEYLTTNSADFHAHMGFVKVGEFHKCGYKFGRWYNMIWMEKIIGEHGAHQAPVTQPDRE